MGGGILHYIAVFIIGTISGFIGSTVGNGGEISIPFLIFLGLPPHIAIATDRFGTLGSSVASLKRFWHEDKIRWKVVPVFVLLSIIGSAIGAHVLLTIDEKLITRIMGVAFLLFIPLLFIKQDIGVVRRQPSRIMQQLGYIAYFFVTLYGGLIGAGTGTLAFMALMIFFGFTIVEANATDILPWFCLAFVSTIIFAVKGLIYFSVGLVLLAGMTLGGYIGAHTALKKGDQWIKTFFIIITIVSSIKLLLS